LRQIIENLLLLARLETGQALDVEPVILRREILRIVKEHEQKVPMRRYELLADQIALAEANPQCIEQIMNNLLENAEKYSPTDSPITVRIAPEGKTVSVSVEDRGVGVDPEEVADLFTPFFRSEKTSGSKGIGIGLSVCRRLVEAQGGRIRAEPRVGGGSTFTFTLQAVHEPAEGDQSTGDAPEETLAPA
jgi:two-component system sensor histidine kinase KdpD